MERERESVCVTSVIQHVKRMRSIISSSVTTPALPYFLHFMPQMARFSEKLLDVCFDFLYKVYLKNFWF
jgi:hypothetical protein